jgi:signal recognition particle subunit SRP54
MRKKVLLVSCDVYRPAAIEQLQTLAGQVGVDFFPSSADQDPVGIAVAAVDWARRHYHDVVIVDTAGRLAIDDAMMREIAALHAAVKPVETLFVVDAMQGQDAVNTAKAFGAVLPLTGVVLTKLDGDARGGAALSLRLATGQRIRFAGTGERPQDLEVFYAERMASRILGMGDVLSLIERAERTIDQEAAKEVESHMRSGHLTFDDFLVQVRQLRSMGSLEGILEMVPGGAKLKGQVAGADTEREVHRIEAVILSMTARERTHPEIIDGARRRRIARGSGLQPADVNRVLKAREAMQQVAKQFGLGNRGSKAGASRLFGQGGSGWSR